MVRNSALLVAAEEWRLWLRSRVVRSAALLFLTLLFATSVATAVSVMDAQHERAHQQIAAEDTFYDQPARIRIEWFTMVIMFIEPHPRSPYSILG